VRNLLKSLPSYGRANKLIFSLNGTKPIDFQFISMRLHKVLEANGIDWRTEGLSFHSFRHFFNTRLVANGVNGELVRATVGHESSDMTKYYLHLVPSDLNTVMDVARQIVNL
jgi:integrase